MKKLIFGVAALLLLLANPALASKGVTPILKMQTTYKFVFPSDIIPAAPFAERVGTLYALVWEGTIEGDVNGVIRWWVEFTPAGAFTAAGRWEIWDCAPEYPIVCDSGDSGLLIMEGKGIVTYANEEYADWYGRRTTDGGYVEFDGGLLSYGEGFFNILNRPSNKH